MASSSPQASDFVTERRLEVAGDGGELNDETRIVQEQNGSTMVNITSVAKKVHSIEKGDKVSVITTADCIMIFPEANDGQ